MAASLHTKRAKWRQKALKLSLSEQNAHKEQEFYQDLQSLLPLKALHNDPRHNQKVILTYLLAFEFHNVDKSSCLELFSENLAHSIDDSITTQENKAMRFILPYLQRHFHTLKIPRFIEHNLAILRQCFNLSKFHTDLLYLLYITSEHTRHYYDGQRLSYHKAISFFTFCLNVKKPLVTKALTPNGALRRFELVQSSEHHDFLYRCSDFVEELFFEPYTKDKILKQIALLVPPSKLELEDFAYMGENLTMLLEICQQIPNPSIYLYGKAGVGKNELVRLIAKVLDKELYEIYAVDENGESYRKKSRFERFYMAQNLLDNHKHIVLVDECEDIFTRFSLMQSFFGDYSGEKSRDNKMIESVRVPSFFLSNSIDLDPALLRRFDLVLEICEPPKDKKRELIERTLNNAKITLDSALLDAITESNLTQGVLLKAAQITSTLSKRRKTPNQKNAKHDKAKQGDFNNANSPTTHTLSTHTLSRAQAFDINTLRTKPRRVYLQEIFLKVLNEQLKAVGKAEIKPNLSPTLPYSLHLIHASLNVATLATTLKKAHCGVRILAYGIAGSGKSAYAKALAKELDKPIILKKASDIFSKWLGESEKNIAKAFTEARQKDAILVFDEVDSFLRERGDAVRSWEITQVNEMLTQMESFEGIFIATTNLVENLDKASIRRFDYKIEFRALDSKRLCEAFVSYAKFLGIRDYEAFLRDERIKLKRLDNICLGDFALIARAARIEAIQDSQSLYEKLLTESTLKDSQKGTKIGLI